MQPVTREPATDARSQTGSSARRAGDSDGQRPSASTSAAVTSTTSSTWPDEGSETQSASNTLLSRAALRPGTVNGQLKRFGARDRPEYGGQVRHVCGDGGDAAHPG